jgi:hypothetical protein
MALAAPQRHDLQQTSCINNQVHVFNRKLHKMTVMDNVKILDININPLTPNDLQRRRAVSPLKIKIPSKNMREKPIHRLFIQFINYVW